MPSIGMKTSARIVADDPAQAEQKAARSLLKRMHFDVSEAVGGGEPAASLVSKPVASTGSLSFWVSWYQEKDPDVLPIASPWWRTQDTTIEGRQMVTMCAAVRADGVDKAIRFIEAQLGEFYGLVRWRFVDHMDDGWSPFSKRFPREDWMIW